MKFSLFFSKNIIYFGVKLLFWCKIQYYLQFHSNNYFAIKKLRRNVIDVSYHISQYQQIIQELAHEISTLKDQRHDLESRISHLDPRVSQMNGDDKLKLEEALKLRESLLQSFKQQINLRKNVLELDNAIMDLSIEVDRHTKIIESKETQKENETTSITSNNSTK